MVRYISREIVVFPHDPFHTPAIVERLKSTGFLILGTAPMSGMILAATALVPGIEEIMCEWVRTWPEVKAAERNVGGETLGKQPEACPPTNSYTSEHCDEPYPLGHIQIDCTPVSGQPNDPTFCYQWGLHNTGQLVVDLEKWEVLPPPAQPEDRCWSAGGVAGIDINLLEAWERTTGSSQVTVAVFDSGIEYCNPDFDDERFLYPDIALTCEGNDGDGYPCYPLGDPPPYGPARDNAGHGTMVASIIGATVDNELGITGIDQNCKLLAGRVFGTGELSHVGPNTARFIIALERIATWEEYESVRVINVSFRLPYIPPDPEPNEQMTALEYAVSVLAWQNRFVVAGSGNYGDAAGLSADDSVPQRFALVFTVGGIDPTGRRFVHPFANPDPMVFPGPHESGVGDCLDFMAPGMGEVVLVCQTPGCTPPAPPAVPSPDCLYPKFPCTWGGHNFVSGTSYAAPKVSAAVSLILARAIQLGIVVPASGWAGLTWADMYEILQAGCRDRVSWSYAVEGDDKDGLGWDDHYGWGLIDIDASMQYLEDNFCCP